MRKHGGYLCDISIERLLDVCRAQRVTGALALESWGVAARIVWHQGEVRAASLGRLHGDDALAEIELLRDGSFALDTEQPVCLDATPAPAPVRLSQPAPVMAGFPARHAVRPAPPPVPVRPLVEDTAHVRLPAQNARPTWSGTWPGHSPVPEYAGATATHHAHPGQLLPRWRLPSTAVSVGILCLTMLCSLVAIQL